MGFGRTSPALWVGRTLFALSAAGFGLAPAQEIDVYGPETFTRGNGKPEVVERTFQVAAGLGGPSFLTIVNGDPTGEHRVSAASIRLNGSEMVGPENFNQQVDLVLREVQLEAQNTLRVRLASAPASRLTVRFTATTTEPPPPPPPPPFAPVLDTTVATDIATATEFLYTGANPVQREVAPGTIEAERAAAVRGRVLDRSGQPLSGVVVTIPKHPELGWTSTRDDGTYDMAVNGGLLVLHYALSGWVPVQRREDVPGLGFAVVADVVLTPFDAPNPIDLSSAAPIQVASGNPVTDADGTRTARLLFAQGTSVQLRMPGGALQPLSGALLTVRATELTVGEEGKSAMPGDLPATSAYTYAVDFSVDEALSANAIGVEFSQAVVHYVENFLGFPVGMNVPAASYDYVRSAWIPELDGLVVKILSETGGSAALDLVGAGLPATATQLAALGITDAERISLAGLYEPEQTLWRTRIPHFSPWDMNWPFGLPAGASGPSGGPQSGGSPFGGPPGPPSPPNDCGGGPPSGDSGSGSGNCSAVGSIVGIDEQTLGEKVPVVGTSLELRYQSDRVSGRASSRTVDFQLSGSAVHADLVEIDLSVEVAGQRHAFTFDRLPDQSHTFTWDGLDTYGREIQGAQNCRLVARYFYPLVYLPPPPGPRSFGRTSGATNRQPANGNVTGSDARSLGWISRQWFVTLGNWNVRDAAVGLGGWTLDQHHAYQPLTRRLELGTGQSLSGDSPDRNVIETAVDGSVIQQSVFGLATGPDGSLYIVDALQQLVVRRAPEGATSVFAGGGTPASGNGDGGPATLAKLSAPQDVAVGADGTVYIVEAGADVALRNRVRRIGLNGIIQTVIGTGSFFGPRGLSVDATGGIYVADNVGHRVWYLDPRGSLAVVAGSGSSIHGGDGGLATAAGVAFPTDVEPAPNGGFYIVCRHRIRFVDPEGMIRTIAGNGTSGYSGDGGLATSARLADPFHMTVTRDGAVIVADLNNLRVRRIGTDGIIRTIVGNGSQVDCGGPSSDCGDGNAPTVAAVRTPRCVAISPDGVLYVGDSANRRVRAVRSSMPGISFDEFPVASPNGSELFVFDGDGRHLRTLVAETGGVRWTFGYDAAGRLSTATDGDGRVTSIGRDAQGRPISILSPYGQLTELEVDAAGHLSSITNPAGEAWRFTYDPSGLMTEMLDPAHDLFEFVHDPAGRLLRDADAAGGSLDLAQSDLTDGQEITVTTALGRVERFTRWVNGGGEFERRNTFGTGATARTTSYPNGVFVRFDPDGEVLTKRSAPDPRWGMQAPFTASESLSTPGGLVRNIVRTRSAVLSDPDDPLSVVQLMETEAVNGKTTTVVYDAAARTRTTTSPAGRVSVETLDELGRVVLSAPDGLAVTSYTWAGGLLQSVAQGSGASWRAISFTYDAAGRRDSYVDTGLGVYEYAYDPAGRVVSILRPDLSQLAMGYDPRGNRSSYVPPGRSPHTFTYTVFDEEATYAAPSVGSGSATTSTAYDLDRQRESVTRPDGSVVGMSYSSGLLSSLTHDDAVIGVAYDVQSSCCAHGERPLTVTRAATGGGATYQLDYTYDGGLRLSEALTGPIGGTYSRTFDNDLRLASESVNASHTVAFQYDDDGLSTGAGALSVARDPRTGLVSSTTLGSVSTSYLSSEFGEVTRMSAAFGSTVLMSIDYERDAFGRIVRKVETTDGPTSTFEYAYDSVGRLSVVRVNGVVTATYEYDENGNRTSLSATTTTISSYDAQDRIVQAGAMSFVHNANGELLSRTSGTDVTTYDHDGMGSLLSVTLPGGDVVSYDIAGWNQRVAKRLNGTIVQGLLYRDELAPVAELDGNGAVVSRFVYGTETDRPDYMTRGGATYRILSDHLGSPRIVVDVATGAVSQRLDYDEFGAVTRDTNPGFQPFGFAGGLLDRNTGLTLHGWRDYDAALGRWIVKDPIHFAGGDCNLYAYVGSDPVNRTDRLGLAGSDFGGINSCGPQPDGGFFYVGGPGKSVGQRLKEKVGKWWSKLASDRPEDPPCGSGAGGPRG